MTEHSYFRSLLFSFILLLPAVMSLFFAWALWLDKKHLEKRCGRAQSFRWALFAATVATVLICIDGARFVDTQAPATGFFLVGNWTALVLWVLGIIGAFTGRGGSRVSLACWAVLLFFGVCGMFVPP